MLKALTNATIFTGSETLTGKAIQINNGRIEAIIDPASIPEGSEVIDCGDNCISAGLIDLQIAGSGGYLFSANPSAEALKSITDAIVRSGTTGFLITIPTNSFEVYYSAIRVVKENPHPAILGIHLEGPYISTLRKGAHIKNYIKSPDLAEIKDLLTESEGVIKMLTVAPEICGDGIIEYLNVNGIVVAAGHSNATFKEAVNGFKRGIKTTTHLFNGMSQMHHRYPGLPGATFETENIKASIIADGIHVDYNMVSIAKKLMNERLFLVTDAVEENMNGAYLHVRQKNRFTLPDGTLSGSILTMMQAVKNCIEDIGIPVEEALRMASAYPIELMNISGRGRIEPGYKADLIVFNKNYEIEHIFIEGVKV